VSLWRSANCAADAGNPATPLWIRVSLKSLYVFALVSVAMRSCWPGISFALNGSISVTMLASGKMSGVLKVLGSDWRRTAMLEDPDRVMRSGRPLLSRSAAVSLERVGRLVWIVCWRLKWATWSVVFVALL